MLIASNPLLEGRSFVYERELRRHISDYTLFFSGLFPEYVARLPRARSRLDSLVDYVKAATRQQYARSHALTRMVESDRWFRPWIAAL